MIKRRKKIEASNNIYQREEILYALQKAISIISSNSLKNEFSKFIFTGSSLISSNNEIGICYPLKTKFKCTVEPEEFYRILSSIQDKDIEIEQKENKLLLVAKNIASELIVDKNIDKAIINIMETIPSLNKTKIKKIPKDFMAGIKNVLISTTRMAGDIILTCVYINDNKMISTDDFRISMYCLDKGFGSKILLSSSLIEEISSYEDISGYCIVDNWIYFFMEENIVLCSKIINEKFPEVKEEFEFDYKEVIFPKDFSYLIKNASILASGNSIEFDADKKIKIKINKGKIFCRGENNLGWIEGQIKIDTKENFSFSINPKFLLDILEKTGSMKLGQGKALFETEKFKHLIALYTEEE